MAAIAIVLVNEILQVVSLVVNLKYLTGLCSYAACFILCLNSCWNNSPRRSLIQVVISDTAL